MLSTVMQWLLSVLLIVNLYLMGNKTVWGPITGIVAQGLWIFYGVMTQQYGLVPGVLILLLINIRNWRKWKAEEMIVGRNTA